MKNWKRFAAVGLSLAMALMTGCGASEKPAAEKTTAEKDAGAKKKVALVCDVAGTQVFILDMIDGLKASAEKHGFEVVIAECADAAAYEDNCRAMVEEGADLIIGGSWQAADAISKVATEFPDKADYALIDSEVDVDNVK